MYKNEYQTEILVNGRALQEFSHPINKGAQPSTLVEARNGTNYSIRIQNPFGKRVLAIVAVDGLNVVTGDKSDGYSGRGYIIKPYGSVIVKGFRVSDSEVGQFTFAGKGASYAAGQGFAKNSGVISVNLISEYEEPPQVQINNLYDPYTKGSHGVEWTACLDSTLGGAQSLSAYADSPRRVSKSAEKKAMFDMGTEFGKAVVDKITRASFAKGHIVATFNIYYASMEALVAMGVPIKQENAIDMPEGFSETAYCKPPRNWSGRRAITG